MALETERAVLLRYTREGMARRGSGLRIGGTYVLTADHCANGSYHTVLVDGRAYPATVALRSGRGDVDLAVLSAPDLPVVPPMSCARVDTNIAAKIDDCVALGFPTWNRPGGVDHRAQADGYVATGEGADPRAGVGGVPLLAFKITTPAILDKGAAVGDLAEPSSPWGGMSGAVIVSRRGAHIIGVVRGHVPAAGVGSLTFTPLGAIDLLPKQSGESFWASLGVADPAGIPLLPELDAAASGAVVIGEIPRPPQGFVARETVQRLAECLDEAGVAAVCALTGLRGVGKTQVAAAYARSRAAAGDAGLVGWVNAASRGDLLTGLARIAQRVGVADPDGDSATSAQRLREHLETRSGTALLVFDNAVDPDGLLEFLPAIGSTRVVITSTDRAFGEVGYQLDVSAFSRAESLAYLRQRTKIDDEVGAGELAAELGDLPVALAQAAATINGQRLNYQRYEQRLSRVPVAVLLGRAPGQGYPQATAAALLLSIETTENEDPTGVTGKLLRAVSVLSPERVRRDLFDTLDIEHVDESSGGRAVDAALERSVRGSLLSWSVGGDAVVMHRLVGRVLRERDRASGGWTDTLATAVGMLEPHLFDESRAWGQRDLGSELVFQIEALWEATTEVVADEPCDRDIMVAELRARTWGVRQLRSAADLTRAIELGCRVAADGERVLGADHPDTLTARNDLADAYESVRYLDKAIPLYEQVLTGRERVLGAEHQLTLASRNNLAGAYELAGRHDEAIRLHERTLADRDRVLGADHPDTLASRNNLAIAYDRAGRHDEAIRLHERSLADHGRFLGADHPHTMASRSNLAAAYGSAGRHDEAIAFYEAAVADHERVLGTDHPYTLTARSSLAAVYLSAGRVDEAIALCERALAELERVLDADHRDTLTTRNNLAVACESAGRLGEAIALFERSLTERERVLGADHSDTEAVRDQLAGAYLSAGRHGDARALYGRIVTDRELTLGAGHPDTEVARDRLAVAHLSAGRLDEAIALFERSLTERERVLGDDHPDTLTSGTNLAVAYLSAGHLDEAIALYERIVTDRERVLGADHGDTLAVGDQLADAYESAGLLEDAIALYERIVTDRERVLGADHPDTLTTRHNLANAYLSAGLLDEAITLNERTLADRERVLGADHPSTLASRGNLADAYHSAGNTDVAITLYAQVISDREKVLGADHPDTLDVRDKLAVAYLSAAHSDEAIVLSERTVTDRERVLGADHRGTLTSRGNLAVAYESAGRLDEAIALFERNVTDSQRVLGVDHPDTLTFRSNLANANKSVGRGDAVIPLLGGTDDSGRDA